MIINKSQALQIVTKNVLHLKTLPSRFQKDKEIVLAAVNNDGFAIVNIDKNFLNDKEVALQAVQNNKLAYLLLINSNLMEDKDILALVT